MKKLIALVVLFLVAAPSFSATFCVVYEVFADNSCRSYTVNLEANCRSAVGDFYCPNGIVTCEARLAPPPYIDLCPGEEDPHPPTPIDPEL